MFYHPIYCACVRTSHTPFYSADPCAWANKETWNARAHTKNDFQQTKIFLLVKDHARNGKKPFLPRNIKSTCGTLAVGQFRRKKKGRQKVKKMMMVMNKVQFDQFL